MSEKEKRAIPRRLKQIVKPDSCNSLNNCSGGDYCLECSHGRYFGEIIVKGRTWKFEFNSRFGPVFLRGDGDPLAVQPAEKNPVWDEWKRWHDEKFGA